MKLDQQFFDDLFDWLGWIAPWVAVVLMVVTTTLLLLIAP